jgi:hypothetical protein
MEREDNVMTPSDTSPRREWRPLRAVEWLGLALALVGYFGPWIPHPTAALTVTGRELAEFAKFFPQVQSGTSPIMRALFVAPLLATSILAGLLANEWLRSPAQRILATVALSAPALLALPPYPFLTAAEYRVQLILAVGGGTLALLTLLTGRLPDAVRGILIALVAVGGFGIAAVQFALLHPLVVSLYGSVLPLGWGLLACGAGLGLVALFGVFRVTGRYPART